MCAPSCVIVARAHALVRRFFIVYDQTEQGVKDQQAARSVLLSPAKERGVQTLEKIADFFHTTAEQVLRKQSYFLRGNTTKYVDIADVLRAVPVYWLAYQVVGLVLLLIRVGG